MEVVAGVPHNRIGRVGHVSLGTRQRGGVGWLELFHCRHRRGLHASGHRDRRRVPNDERFTWVNTMLGNVKNALHGIYQTLSPMDLQRYLSEFCYRFNRRFDLTVIPSRLLRAAARTLCRNAVASLLVVVAPATHAAHPWHDMSCLTSERAAASDEQKFGGSAASPSDALLQFHYPLDARRSSTSEEAEPSTVPHRATLGIRYRDGWLLGDHRGEWGGEVVFVPNKGEPYVVIDSGPIDFFAMPFGTIALAGYAHMSEDDGYVYLIGNEDGRVRARRLHGLPGQPRAAYRQKSGALLIRTKQGDVLLSATGELAPVRCTGISMAPDLAPARR
ncbi:MAG: transposase [Rhodanobacteraceae bacterium]|nr:transposase [Rhodanobacteraceae bacterium]